MKKYKTISFEDMSDFGLVYKINKEILHPLGLALYYEQNGPSKGCLVDEEDFKWEFEEEFEKECLTKLKRFEKDHVGAIKNKLKEKK